METEISNKNVENQKSSSPNKHSNINAIDDTHKKHNKGNVNYEVYPSYHKELLENLNKTKNKKK